MSSTSFVSHPAVSLQTPATEEAPLAAVFGRCAASLYRYFAVRTGNDPHRADDFMQQLWLSASTARSHPEAPQIEFWLRAIARNLVHGWYRKVAREAAHFPRANPALAAELADRLVTTDLPAVDLERREVQDQMLLALTALESEHQELIVEHYFQERSHAELAARRGLSPRAIEGRLYRARAALREKLEALET